MGRSMRAPQRKVLRCAREQMAYENLLYEKRDGIAFITFNRPKVLNALNRKTVEELQQVLLDARGDDAVRVLDFDRRGRKVVCCRSGHRRTFAADAGERQRVFAVRTGSDSFAGDDGEAIDLRDQWICAWRRMRGCACVHDSNRQQDGEAGTAGSEAGNYSGVWRDRSGWRGYAARAWRRSFV